MKAAREDGFRGKFVLSTTTATGREMAERLGKGVFDIHIYYPWDKKEFVAKALDALAPAAFAVTETELWPNMLFECDARGVPAFLINGRISDRAWKRINRPLVKGVAASCYSLFSKILLRGTEDERRLLSVGVGKEKLAVTGDSKIDALLARRDESARDAWLEKFGRARKIFIAGSTHTGEDETVIAAFERVRSVLPSARLIIAPRHPQRSDAVMSLIPEKYIKIKLSELAGDWDVLVVDKVGVLFDLYGTAEAAFVGGSFADKGGQNILEPFLWGTPVQYGPHMEDFAEISRDLISVGAATQARSGKELADAWRDIAEKGASARTTRESEEYFSKSRGAAGVSWKIVKEYLAAGKNKNDERRAVS